MVALVAVGIPFSTSVISASGGRVKFILKMDVFMLVSHTYHTDTARARYKG